MKFILGKKLKMTQIWKDEKVAPVTLIEAGPCWVTQKKTKDKDRYEAIQFGFEKIEKKNKIKKTMRGKEFKYLKEYKLSTPNFQLPTLKVGDKIDVGMFREGEKVKVSGVSKGKGFAGAVKRWGFHGMPATHGSRQDQRRLGSVGCRWPQRVIKGKKMPGRMGSERVTIKNLKIVKVDKENNLLAVKGAIPGRKGTLLEIRG